MRTISALAVAMASVRGEVSRYWKTPALLAAAVAAGLGLAVPAVSVHGRLALDPWTASSSSGSDWCFS